MIPGKKSNYELSKTDCIISALISVPHVCRDEPAAMVVRVKRNKVPPHTSGDEPNLHSILELQTSRNPHASGDELKTDYDLLPISKL